MLSDSNNHHENEPINLERYGINIVNSKKLFLASIFEKYGISNLLLHSLASKPYIRVIYYHSTDSVNEKFLIEHLKFYKDNFVPVGLTELNMFINEKKWPHRKPGLILSFDDGLRNNYDVAKPVLEDYSFPGWFFIPSAFPDCPVPDQPKFAAANRIWCSAFYKDGRIAMSWQELHDLSRWHVIGSHTHNHCRMTVSISSSQLRDEIQRSRVRLYQQLGCPIDCFSWVGGEEWSYTSDAAKTIHDGGYKFSFMTNNRPVTFKANPLQIQRTNIEAYFPLFLVKFQLCGILDVMYYPKRTRVNKLTQIG